MNKHSPGPWTWFFGFGDSGGRETTLCDDQGTAILHCGHIRDFDAAAIAAVPAMLAALREWKCPGCGGTGTYQQNAAGRVRDEARGRKPCPKFCPDPVPCKVCKGGGLHPTAAAAIGAAETV